MVLKCVVRNTHFLNTDSDEERGYDIFATRGGLGILSKKNAQKSS